MPIFSVARVAEPTSHGGRIVDEPKKPRTRKSPVEQSPGAEEESPRKVGFLLSPEIDFKLTVYARKMKLPRSTVVEKCLEEKLSGVTVSFRGKSREEGEAA